MAPAELIPLAINVSMALIVFGVGLRADLPGIVALLRRPGLFVRSLVAMNVIVPLFAVAFVLEFDFHPAIEIALVALAVSPVPPVLPQKEMKAGGTASYIVALLAIAALVSIVFVPAAIQLLGRVLGRAAHVPIGAVATIVARGVLAPLVLGIVVHVLARSLAARIAKPVATVGMGLLLAPFLAVLVKVWPAMVSLIGSFTLVAITAFVLVGLAVGHLLGGPEPEDRTVLALSTATRHPGVALAIANLNAPEEKLVPAAVLLYLLAGAIVTLPYVQWRRRHAAAAEGR